MYSGQSAIPGEILATHQGHGQLDAGPACHQVDITMMFSKVLRGLTELRYTTPGTELEQLS